MFKIILVLPATSVEAGRSFPTMKRVTTWLCFTMSADSLSGVSVLRAHKQRLNNVFVERVVTTMKTNKRRLNWI